MITVSNRYYLFPKSTHLSLLISFDSEYKGQSVRLQTIWSLAFNLNLKFEAFDSLDSIGYHIGYLVRVLQYWTVCGLCWKKALFQPKPFRELEKFAFAITAAVYRSDLWWSRALWISKSGKTFCERVKNETSTMKDQLSKMITGNDRLSTFGFGKLFNFEISSPLQNWKQTLVLQRGEHLRWIKFGS